MHFLFYIAYEFLLVHWTIRSNIVQCIVLEDRWVDIFLMQYTCRWLQVNIHTGSSTIFFAYKHVYLFSHQEYHTRNSKPKYHSLRVGSITQGEKCRTHWQGQVWWGTQIPGLPDSEARRRNSSYIPLTRLPSRDLLPPKKFLNVLQKYPTYITFFAG